MHKKKEHKFSLKSDGLCSLLAARKSSLILCYFVPLEYVDDWQLYAMSYRPLGNVQFFISFSDCIFAFTTFSQLLILTKAKVMGQMINLGKIWLIKWVCWAARDIFQSIIFCHPQLVPVRDAILNHDFYVKKPLFCVLIKAVVITKLSCLKGSALISHFFLNMVSLLCWVHVL